MTNLLIFDLDGVLADTEPVAWRVWAEVLNRFGIPITVEQIGTYVGWTAADMYADISERHGWLVPDEAVQEVRKSIVDAVRAELTPMPGLTSALDVLVNERSICVASNGSYSRVLGTIDALGLTDYFAPHIFSAEQVDKGKPAPDLFLHAAAQFDASPENCLVIEDSLHGVAAALAANMTVYGFTGASHFGPEHAGALADAGAALVFGNMTELPELIRRNS